MPQTSEELLERLLRLLSNFEHELENNALRTKVIALIPVHETLLKLGQSLIPPQIASSARDRILHYFQKYPQIPLARKEIVVVAGIDEWARRVRELRVEHGWSIITGSTAKQMDAQGEFELHGIDVSQLRGDDYILLSLEQDREAAFRWSVAKDIRGRRTSVQNKLLEFLRANVGRPVTGEELRYIAKDATEWARRVRELRTEEGWPIVTKSAGRPDLAIGVYLLEEDRQSPTHDRRIPDNVRGTVLRRDGYKCQHCGWSHEEWNPSDPRHLELHHIEAHARGGENTDENLVTLCTVCHDQYHRDDSQSPVSWEEWSAS